VNFKFAYLQYKRVYQFASYVIIVTFLATKFLKNNLNCAKWYHKLFSKCYTS